MAVEPVSVTIGAVSLAFQAFSGCMYVFTTLRRAQNLGKDAGAIQCMLSWAEWRLVAWAKESGLYNDNMRCTSKEAVLIRSTLAEIESLMSDTSELKKRFKLDLQEMNEQSEIDDGIKRIGVNENDQEKAETFLTGAISQEERLRILKKARLVQSVNGWPKRHFWAACGKSNFQELVRNIHGYIDQLSMYLEPRHREEIDRKLDSIFLKTVEISQKVPDLLALVDAVKVQHTPSPVCEDSGARQLEGIARTRALHISLGLDDESNSFSIKNIVEQRTIDPDLTLPIELDVRKLVLKSPDDSANARGIAEYDEKGVYVEWKPIRDRRQIRKLKPRIQALCRLLRAPKPSSFCSLKCRGVAEIVGQDRFAIVFDMPTWWESSGFASTLGDCVMWPAFRPSATVRKSLALQLCTTVLHLHTSGWVHKAIRPSNITFFYPKKPETLHDENLLARPFLVGYEYARLDDPSQSSELQSSAPGVDIYRHPDILGGEPCSFLKKHDIYALGLVLLELGTWSRLQQLLSLFVDLEKEPTSPKIRQVRDYVLGNVERPTGYTVLQLLRFRMGDVYTDIVESCLDGTSFTDTGPNGSLSTPTAHFNDLVVRKLSSHLM